MPLDDGRSLRPEVRNPLLDLPEMKELVLLLRQHPEIMAAVVRLLFAIWRHARKSADESWLRNKAPMAFYWKVVCVYVGHIRRAITWKDWA